MVQCVFGTSKSNRNLLQKISLRHFCATFLALVRSTPFVIPARQD
jgi:hypothetical protein